MPAEQDPQTAPVSDPSPASPVSPDLVRGDDGRLRPAWASGDALLREYYDTEWGMPVRDERGLFERLSLEAFQSGLSWAIILRKREAFRAAFTGFDPEDPDLPGDLPQLLWSFQPASTPAPMTVAEVPTQSAESAALARELKRRGFRFVGPTTAYALMEAVGMVDTHLVGSWRRGTSGVW